MQTPKGRGSPKASPQKLTPRPVRQLKIDSSERSSPSSSTQATARTPKDKSPIIAERRSPRSPITEKKRPSKLSELESQLSKLQNDQKTLKEQLISSELSKQEAQEDAEDAKRQLAEVSLKLEDTEKKVSELHAVKNASVPDLHSTSESNELEWESRIEAVHGQYLAKSASLALAEDEIQKLKLQLEEVSESKDVQCQLGETTQIELQSLKVNLEETLSLVESMKVELEQSKAQSEKLVNETLQELAAARECINLLRSDAVKSSEAFNSVNSELHQSKAQVCFLEDFVNNLKKISSPTSGDLECDKNFPQNELNEQEKLVIEKLRMDLQSAESEVRHLKSALEAAESAKSEVRQLKSALEAAEIRFNDERSHGNMQFRSASELVEQSGIRVGELEEELSKAKTIIDQLKANLMDKETELQGISEENEELNSKLLKSVSSQREKELEVELKNLMEHVAIMKANMLDKETELQNVLEENEMLKLEISKQEMDKGFEATQIAAEVEAAKAAEQVALTKLGCMMEEADKSNRKTSRVVEQLEASQAANAEMEAELRRLKVQSDQWRKAAEAAASMLSPGSNGKYVERTGSMPLDGKYSPVGRRINSPYLDDYDDDSFKKKNGNVLKKIGVLWKKPQK